MGSFNNSTYYNGATNGYTLPKESVKEAPKAIQSMNISISLDSEQLTKEIADYAEKRIIDKCSKAAEDLILKRRYYNTGYSSAGEYDLKDWVVDEIKKCIADSKDQIIELAAIKLADSMRRSKPVREKFCELLEEEMKT